jgi:phosphoglycolate phosphatase
MIRLVIFDFDGTLANTRPYLMGILKELEPKYHYPLISQDVAMSKPILKILFEDLKIPFWKIPFFIRDVTTRMFEKSKQARMYPGMPQVLAQVSKKYLTGIVTGNDEATVRIVLKRTLAKEMLFIHGRVPLFRKHIVFRRLIRTYGLAPKDILYIGDELRDIAAARKAGVKIGAVSWGYNTPRALKAKHPDYLFRNPSSVRRVLKG